MSPTMRKNNGTIIWPAYIDSTLTRSQGRRIPANLAAPNVTIDVLTEAAQTASLEFDVEAEKLYPRTWSEGVRGYIVVSGTSHSKKRLLLMLAKSVRKIVAQRASAERAASKKKGKKKRK
ncbi:MAG: signal recognition particle subunit SRP19/SEC65 family protein [Candidatus Thorarchaeota archaeon]